MDHYANPFDRLYSQIHREGRFFGYSSDYFAWRAKQTKGELAGYIEGTGKILDVGGGIGTLLKFLPRTAQRSYFNLDYSLVNLSLCPPAYKTQASGLRMPFQNDQFEYAVCSEVLEHVPDKVALIAECYRVLKMGGRFLVTTPRTGWLNDYMHSRFRVFGALRDVQLQLKSFVPGRLRATIRRKLKRSSPISRPAEIPDDPSDETWLRSQIENTGFAIERQYRVDTHFPFGGNQGESAFWRWFSDRFVDPRVFGHCTLVVARKPNRLSGP